MCSVLWYATCVVYCGMLHVQCIVVYYMQLNQLGLQTKLKGLLQTGPSVRHQVLRLLVYTGELIDDQQDYLFSAGGYSKSITFVVWPVLY